MQSNLISATCSALPTIHKHVIIKVVIHTSHWYLLSTLDIHTRHLGLTSTLNINTETYTIHLNRDIHNPISNTSSNLSDSSTLPFNQHYCSLPSEDLQQGDTIKLLCQTTSYTFTFITYL